MTQTPSLRRRVIVSVLALLSVVLLTLGVVIDVAFGAQVRRDLHDRLEATAARADALATAGTSPWQLAAQLNGGGIRALLVTPGGTKYGDPAITGAGPGETLPAPPPRRLRRPTIPVPAARRPRRPGHRRLRTRPTP